MATEKRYIDANAIPWEEYYVPDPDSNAQWDYKKEFSVTKPIVDQMPTVDAVEVVHGRWKIVDSGFDWELNCSLCGEQYWIEKDELETHKPKYCPNCGAKMDGDGND